jgi:pyrroloquinoline quinone (PQQ) biosynthesis protein C
MFTQRTVDSSAEVLASNETERPPSPLAQDLFRRLDQSIADLWARARRGRFWRQVVSRGFDRELYRLVMVQIFHYTRHNSINQAATALRALPEEPELLRFIYSHAREELGHERLVVRDLESIGLLSGEALPEAPLPATDALIHYLYGVALREGPVARLGYSYWAESIYQQIAPLLLAARRSLSLTDANLTFFVAHAEIDSKHAEQVRTVLRRAASTPERAEAVHRVAVTSLWLTLQILEQSLEASGLGQESP